MSHFFEEIAKAEKAGEAVALATVVETHGSVPRRPGARMLVFADGHTTGTVGGGNIEHEIIEIAKTIVKKGGTHLQKYALQSELNMACGGQMTVFIERLGGAPHLVVVGCGHVGAALIRSAAAVGFDITAVDDRPGFASAERLPEASRFLDDYSPEGLEKIRYDEDTYVFVATHGHDMDLDVLSFCIHKPLKFLGVIGSKRKAIMQRKKLSAAGISDELLDTIHCPVGVDIGAETPEEIAISIVGELIETRRGGKHFK
ncbi:XdhC family protein [Myxococcota bacterium]|nr:XdhC family protein [Myxococcota bacterium]